MWVLKLKHRQIFIISMIAGGMANFTIGGSETLTLAISLTGTFIYFLWPLLVSHSLFQLVHHRIKLSYNFFLINAFIVLISYVSIMIISNGAGMTFTGLAALPGFYVFFALLYCTAFPVRLLNTIEKEREVTFSEYILDFFLVIFFPIGIWILQPRMNLVAKKFEKTNV